MNYYYFENMYNEDEHLWVLACNLKEAEDVFIAKTECPAENACCTYIQSEEDYEKECCELRKRADEHNESLFNFLKSKIY